jgi:DNA invertase Pin-like site-specific DNA recombinase
LYICKKSPAQWRYPTRASADFATRRDSITLQVLGAVAKLERPLIAERNAAQRLSIPAPIRSEHLGSPSTGFS